jgi:hypothetical protein
LWYFVVVPRTYNTKYVTIVEVPKKKRTYVRYLRDVEVPKKKAYIRTLYLRDVEVPKKKLPKKKRTYIRYGYTEKST